MFQQFHLSDIVLIQSPSISLASLACWNDVRGHLSHYQHLCSSRSLKWAKADVLKTLMAWEEKWWRKLVNGKIPSKFIWQLWRKMKSWTNNICRCPNQETLAPSEKTFVILLRKTSSWLTINSGAVWDRSKPTHLLGGIYSITAFFCQNS